MPNPLFEESELTTSPARGARAPLPLDDDHWMGVALEQARAALAHEDVPVGCVLVDASGAALAAERNRRELDRDPTAHCEVLVLRAAATARETIDASRKSGVWRLENTTLYVTLEPCPMCAGALVNARVRRVVYAASDPKAGAAGSVMDLCRDPRLNHRLEVRSGVRADEAAELLRAFFRARR